MTAIHQLVAGFSKGDAISNEALTLRDIFRSWGFESDIYCEQARILPELRKEAIEATRLADDVSGDDISLLHLSIGSNVNELFPALPCRKAILYHNSTPPEYFELVNPRTAQDLRKARTQLRALASVADVNLADSEFNALELKEMGYAGVKVLPLVADLENLKMSPSRRVLKSCGDGKINVLFVGRCAPNKKIEDLLKTFFYFQNYVQPDSRLIHVGSFAGTERYHYLLLTMCKDLGLRDVVMAGSVPQDELNAYYESADLFLCESEHEGFCMPLLEAMSHDIPVLAYAAAAVPETMDGAGVLFREKTHSAIAELMGMLCGNRDLRSAVIEGQRRRLERYARRNLESELRGHLEPLLPETGGQ